MVLVEVRVVVCNDDDFLERDRVRNVIAGHGENGLLEDHGEEERGERHGVHCS